MSDPISADRKPDAPLRIVHVVRDPLGGILRNILDLAEYQAAEGHAVGLISGMPSARQTQIDDLPAHFKLGSHRVIMGRRPGMADMKALAEVRRLTRSLNPDIVHGHGAKGGVYARLSVPGSKVYSPHGGVLHYSGQLSKPFFWIENVLQRRTDGLIFVAKNERDAFLAKVGQIRARSDIIYNGLRAEEYLHWRASQSKYDFAFIGHLRPLKGVDVLLDALTVLANRGIRPSVLIAGPGEDIQVNRYKRIIADRSLSEIDFFPTTVNVIDTLQDVRVALMPSLQEALGYFALEVAAAGVPLIATNVGGLPEVFGPTADDLIQANDPDALANAMENALHDPVRMHAAALRRRDHVRDNFSYETMGRRTLELYGMAMSARGIDV